MVVGCGCGGVIFYLIRGPTISVSFGRFYPGGGGEHGKNRGSFIVPI